MLARFLGSIGSTPVASATTLAAVLVNSTSSCVNVVVKVAVEPSMIEATRVTARDEVGVGVGVDISAAAFD
jgi:hypothetical protein